LENDDIETARLQSGTHVDAAQICASEQMEHALPQAKASLEVSIVHTSLQDVLGGGQEGAVTAKLQDHAPQAADVSELRVLPR
jgi:hypothetical protein